MQIVKKEKFELVRKLKDRFSRDKIKNQHYYIKHMNKKLQIQLSAFLTDPCFQKIKESDISHMLKEVPFFKVSNHKVTLTYPNQQSTVILTGIQTKYVKMFVKEYEDSHSNNQYRNFSIEDVHYLDFWSAIKLNSRDAALVFQKFVRNKKKQLDYEGKIQYKMDKKRIRIVIQNEDFFTILADLMNQQQSKMFVDTFAKTTFRGLLYLPLQNNYNHSKPEEQFQQNISDQFKSKSSDIESSIKELIETKNQGIQIEVEETLEEQMVKSSQKIVQTQQIAPKLYKYTALKKKYQEYKRKQKLKEFDLPEFIQKEPVQLIYRKKFFQEVFRSGRKNIVKY